MPRNKVGLICTIKSYLAQKNVVITAMSRNHNVFILVQAQASVSFVYTYKLISLFVYPIRSLIRSRRIWSWQIRGRHLWLLCTIAKEYIQYDRCNGACHNAALQEHLEPLWHLIEHLRYSS